MNMRIPWDKYEAAILLDYCIKVENGDISRNEAIATVSQVLRQRAISAGHKINEVFRNENGISMQLSAMRNCYLGKKSGLTISKLFYEIVELQKNNPIAFYKLLKEESGKTETSTWQQFLQWLRNKYPKDEKNILHSLMMVGAIGRKNHTMKKPLGEITDPTKIEELIEARILGLHSKKNVAKAYYALHKYKEFLQCEKTSNQNLTERKQVREEGVVCNDEVYFVDFLSHQNYSHTKPVACKYKGVSINLPGWNAIFHALVQAIYREYKDVFPVGKSLSSSTRVDTGAPDNMIYPKEIADGIYLECNVNANGIVSKLRSLMDICHIDYSNIEIQYRVKGKGIVRQPTQKLAYEPKWEPQYTEDITKILLEKFKYGFRISSIIELMKIRNYAEAEGMDLPSSDDELEKEISAAGTLIDGKIYVFSKKLLDKLGVIIDEIFQTGVTVIFLNAFVEQQADWLEENYIQSKTILKEALKQCRPHLYFGQNIISNGSRITEHEAVVAEIHRVAGNKAIVCLADLADQLKYIPYDKIAWSLSTSDEFVRIGEGKYFRMRYFICSSEDVNEILSFVSEECNSKGYASFSDVPMNRIAEENYELSNAALYSAVYISILKGHYYLNDKILTEDENGTNVTALLKNYCQDRDECSVAEMMNWAEGLTGSANKQHLLIALYDTMVRVDVDRFVSDKHVNFDVDRIDYLLEEIVGDKFAPLRKISTFALFPTCGVSWNYYLLESYCYRFSRKFRLSVLNYNNKNAGIIVAVDFPLSYTEMLCEAVAKADIDLTPEAVGEYLFTNGYTARRKYSSMPEIIEKAKIIREEK